MSLALRHRRAFSALFALEREPCFSQGNSVSELAELRQPVVRRFSVKLAIMQLVPTAGEDRWEIAHF
jgi:hypothetical protein